MNAHPGAYLPPLPATPCTTGAPDLPRPRATAGTVTVFSTVGFGDISPKSEAARVVLMGQMLGDLAVLGPAYAYSSGPCSAAASKDPIPAAVLDQTLRDASDGLVTVRR